jgi:alpha-beta hydrolase superfamily lysophospholipase
MPRCVVGPRGAQWRIVSAVTRHALLHETSAGPVHLVIHVDAETRARDTVVTLLPPFGWDDVCSYRPRREWADALAADGYVAARLSYPSAGDSDGAPTDPGRVAAWTTSLRETAAWLRTAYARPRCALIGIELSGLLACQAIAEGLAVDDLVLWAAPATGRQFLRRMQALSNLEATADDTGADPSADVDRGLLAGGFLLNEETVADLRTLDVAQMQGLGSRVGRVMLHGRDEIAADNRLRTHLADTGADISRGAGSGYSNMTAPSFEATTPHATVAEVGAWLDAASTRDDAPATLPALPDGPVALAGDRLAIQERQLTLEGPNGVLAGVLTEPVSAIAGGLCAVFLNTGTIRSIGPNRLWVEAARRWAGEGVRSVRFDLDGMGDSDGDPEPYRDLSRLYDPWIVNQVTSVIDQLHAGGHGDRFLLVGLSAGAYWALHAGLNEDRVAAVALINPGALVWDPGTSALGDFRTMRTIAQTRSISLATLRKALGTRGLALAVWLLRGLVAKLRPGRSEPPMLVSHADEMREAVAELCAMSAYRLFVCCQDEPSLEEITELGLLGQVTATPGLRFVRIASNDHTVRPAWAQRELHAALDGLLAETQNGARGAEAPERAASPRSAD